MVILITGITSGFGRAMAARLSADGHKVYGTHRKATDLLPGVTYIRADAQNAADCEAAVKQVLDAEGRIDVFINNAGMGIPGQPGRDAGRPHAGARPTRGRRVRPAERSSGEYRSAAGGGIPGGDPRSSRG